MATAADLARYADASRDVRRLAVVEAEDLWATLDFDDPVEVREALEDVLPDLMDVYGDLSATVAADYYDDIREQAEVRTSFSAILSAPVAAEAVRANARWAIGPLFSAEPDPDQAFGRLAQEVDRMTLDPGNRTIGESTLRDPERPRWARVPQGAAPCAFCQVMASRGAMFYGQAQAGGEGDFYHADCECVPMQVYAGAPLPETYDPDTFYERYLAAREAAGSDQLKPILSSMRQQLGIH